MVLHLFPSPHRSACSLCSLLGLVQLSTEDVDLLEEDVGSPSGLRTLPRRSSTPLARPPAAWGRSKNYKPRDDIAGFF